MGYDLSSEDALKEFMQKEFESKFKNYKAIIENVNAEANAYNASIKEYANYLLTKRKEKASLFALLSQKLEIPLKSNSKPLPVDYSIPDEHFQIPIMSLE